MSPLRFFIGSPFPAVVRSCKEEFDVKRLGNGFVVCKFLSVVTCDCKQERLPFSEHFDHVFSKDFRILSLGFLHFEHSCYPVVDSDDCSLVVFSYDGINLQVTETYPLFLHRLTGRYINPIFYNASFILFRAPFPIPFALCAEIEVQSPLLFFIRPDILIDPLGRYTWLVFPSGCS